MSSSSFSQIDPVLSNWARSNGLQWLTDYRDDEVRTLLWPLSGKESVQLWVDAPADERAAVNVVHNRPGGGGRKWQRSVSPDELRGGLDEALKTAMNWKIELLNAED